MPETTTEQRLRRQLRTRARLAAVNGIVIPSKVPPGQPPYRNPFIKNTSQDYVCCICNAGFSRPDHVRYHFPACVGSNGNPDGARWDDGMAKKNITREPRISGKVQIDFDQRVITLPQHLAALPGVSDMLTFFDSQKHHQQTLQVNAPPSFHIPDTSLQDTSQPQNDLVDKQEDDEICDASLEAALQAEIALLDDQQNDDQILEHRMSHSTNEVLLATLEAWQEVILAEEKPSPLGHPQFARLMEELLQRYLVDENWRWTTSFSAINFDFVRCA